VKKLLRRILGVKPEVVVWQITSHIGVGVNEDEIRDAILIVSKLPGWGYFKGTLLAAIAQHADRHSASDGKPGSDSRELGYAGGLARAYGMMQEAEVPKKKPEDDDE